MELKRVWMSRDAARKSHFALHAVGGVVGIVALVMALTVGGVFLAARMGLPQQLSLLALGAAVTVLGVALGLGLGRRTAGEATVFFLTTDDRLFVLDVRTIARFGQGEVGYLTGAGNTQKLLRALAEHPRLPGLADEVYRVTAMQEYPADWSVQFLARRPGRAPVPRTCLVEKACPDGDLLLRELERRLTVDNPLEPAPLSCPRSVLFSGAALAGAVALCVLSHPAVGRLPQVAYFPCLGAALLAAWLFGYFWLRHRRGE